MAKLFTQMVMIFIVGMAEVRTIRAAGQDINQVIPFRMADLPSIERKDLEKTKQQGSRSKPMQMYDYLLKHMNMISASGQRGVFGIMVVGEAGTGKSCLVNNLLGKELAEEGHGVESKSAGVHRYAATVHNVPVVIYDTPGVSDSDGGKDADHMKAIETALKSKDIQLIIFCQNMPEYMMRRRLIRTFQRYHAIGVDWTRTLIALTFADSLPISAAEMRKEGFNEGQHFDQKLEEWNKKIRNTLIEHVGLKQDVAESIKIRPTSVCTDDRLPNDEGWYVPLWLDILEILTPWAMVRFFEIQDGNIIVHLNEEQKSRFLQILPMQIDKWKVKMKDAAGAIIKGLSGNVMSFLRNIVMQKKEDNQSE